MRISIRRDSQTLCVKIEGHPKDVSMAKEVFATALDLAGVSMWGPYDIDGGVIWVSAVNAVSAEDVEKVEKGLASLGFHDDIR